MADYAMPCTRKTYITTEGKPRQPAGRACRADGGRARGWEAYRQDTNAAAELTLRMYPMPARNIETQKRSRAQVP